MTGLLQGKTIAILGAGPGFGTSLALRAAAQGANVVVAARTKDKVDKIAQQVKDAGGNAIALSVDATNAEQVQHMVATTLDAFGSLDGLVYSAFSNPSMKVLADTDSSYITNGINVSVVGALSAIQTCTEALTASGGSIVMMSSAVIHHSRERYATYKIAKSASRALAESLATELGPSNIRINSVAPGYIWGETLKQYFEALTQKFGGTRDDIYNYTAEKLDLRRLPTEAEIADPVLFLLSDLASGVTGQTLTVDCGEFHG